MDIAQLIVTIALAAVFIGMGINHFRAKPARIMAKMIPPFLRRDGFGSPLQLVYLTGVCEVLGGIGLLVPATRLAAVIALIVFLVAVFPANVYVAQHPETFKKLSIPFWPRLAGQLVLIGLLVFVAL
ncbi:MAG: DoxX family protein [Microbacteriaceae bacterium]